MRRTHLKRIVGTIAGIMLMLVMYVAGAPIADIGMRRMKIGSRYPMAQTYFRWAYAPVVYLHEHPEAPGGKLFQNYLIWCNEALGVGPDGLSKDSEN